MVKELTEVWIPENILFRDKQIKEIEYFFEFFKKEWRGKNIVLQGNTGNGKTLIIDSIRNKEGNKEVHLYAKVQEKGTCFQLFRDLFNIQDARTIGNIVQKGIEKLRKEPKAIIIDELNRFNKKEIKACLSCLNEISRETELPICIITNIFGINQYMRDDQKSSLQFYFIDFPPYTCEELYQIFLDRKQVIEKNNPNLYIPEKDLYVICSLVFEKGIGSARQVRRVLNDCIDSDNFTEKKIMEIIEGTFDESCFKRISNMPQSDRNFLRVLLLLHEVRKDNVFQGIEYDEFITALGGLSKQRISYFVDVFENEYHLIFSKYPSGRGRKRVVFLDKFFFDNAVKFGAINPDTLLPEN